jgi:hypothetical protein
MKKTPLEKKKKKITKMKVKKNTEEEETKSPSILGITWIM